MNYFPDVFVTVSFSVTTYASGFTLVPYLKVIMLTKLPRHCTVVHSFFFLEICIIVRNCAYAFVFKFISFHHMIRDEELVTFSFS